MIADLHMHSTYSDGLYTPDIVVRKALLKGVGVIALTDHDTLSGTDIFYNEAIKNGIIPIKGIELSTRHNDESIHILGYFNEEPKEELYKILDEQRINREQRAKRVITKLDEFFNIKIKYEDIVKHAKNGIIARPHIAQTIIDSGYNYTKEEIFQKMIGEGMPAYLKSTNIETIDGIHLLKAAGAFVVLAHPVLIKKTRIEEFVKMGLDGIEAIYPSNKNEDTMKFLELAKAYGLTVTAGSDFHGFIDQNHHDIKTSFLDDEKTNIFLNKLKGAIK